MNEYATEFPDKKTQLKPLIQLEQTNKIIEMAATAYASLVSLLNTIHHIHIHHLLSNRFNNLQKKSLREKVSFFVHFLENYSDAAVETEDLVRRIGNLAHQAEDIIEIHSSNQIRASASTQQSPNFMPDLQLIIEELDSIKEKVGNRLVNPKPTYSSPSTPSISTPMVGFDSYVQQLSNQLIGHYSGREIIPIVGMGGVGKTTLAKHVYESLVILRTFSVRAWVTVSQNYSARDILLQALSCLGTSTNSTDTDSQLGLKLHQTLYGRRYLIVLDDIWSVEAWEKIMNFLPENRKRSRIVVTTRETKLVSYFGSSAIAVEFLDYKNSWALFCLNAFGQEGCSSHLEEVGKKIVEKCKGLPLTIVVMGAFLGKSPKTLEFWEKIAEDKSVVLESPLSILYLSYKHLPVWLKSCFLYLGLFPEDYEIEVSELTKLYVAEGFIKPNADRSLEEVAQTYIKDLVDRNLLLVDPLELNKRYRTCKMHDLVRDLCVGISEKEKFLFIQRDINGKRHFISDERIAMLFPCTSEIQTPSIKRPQIVERGQEMTPYKSRLLRVLYSDDPGEGGDDSGESELDKNLGEVNLRFLFQTWSKRMLAYEIPSSISLVWNLQTLIIHGNIQAIAPSEIWEMPQLRHIKILLISLPDPPCSEGFLVLKNLQTIRKVKNLIWTEEICKRMPNIEELGVEYNFHEHSEPSSGYQLHNLGRLNRLKSLYFYCSGREYIGGSMKNLKLPSSLKELILLRSKLAWSDMAMIASLPHLEILTLHSNAFVGEEWNCVEHEFLCLKHLQINACGDLIKWYVPNSSSFPVLETLSVKHLYKLEEIPSSIGEIPTLEKMYLLNCSGSASISAAEILEEQESRGNLGIQLQLNFKTETDEEMFREKIQEFGITCQNLLIIPCDGSFPIL